MNGRYLIIRDGEVVFESKNVITDQGREAILRYLAGEVGAWAMSMVFGSGQTPATAQDENLEFEFYRSQITFRAADLANSEVILRAPLPAEMSGKAFEIGLWSTNANVNSNSPSSIITSFSPDDEDIIGQEDGHWTPGGASRVGSSSITVDGPGAAVVSFLSQGLDLAAYELSDRLSLAYVATASLPSTIEIRAYSSSTDYYSYSFSPTGADGDYRIHSWPVSGFIPTGSPSWNDVTSVEVIVTNAGGSSIILDGLRIDDSSRYSEYAFVSRTVLAEPITTLIDEDTQVEYRFGAF